MTDPNHGDRSGDPAPHHALNNPATDPDPTEWPDPYDEREDPRGPEEEAESGFAVPHPPTGSESTSEHHPSKDPEAGAWEGPKRDKVDD